MIVEFLSLKIVELLGSLDFFHNLLDLLGDLVSFQLSLDGLHGSRKEGDLTEPTAGVVGSSPDFIHLGILDRNGVRGAGAFEHLETETIRLYT
jgi:hypothetical protein